MLPVSSHRSMLRFKGTGAGGKELKTGQLHIRCDVLNYVNNNLYETLFTKQNLVGLFKKL